MQPVVINIFVLSLLVIMITIVRKMIMLWRWYYTILSFELLRHNEKGKRLLYRTCRIHYHYESNIIIKWTAYCFVQKCFTYITFKMHLFTSGSNTALHVPWNFSLGKVIKTWSDESNDAYMHNDTSIIKHAIILYAHIFGDYNVICVHVL